MPRPAAPGDAAGGAVAEAARPAWEVFMAALAILSLAIAVLYESEGDPGRARLLVWADLAIVAVFLAEWLYRLAKAGERGRWALRNSWHLLGMVPILVPAGGYLRFLRLLRLVRILRVMGRMGRFIQSSERIAKASGLARLALISGSITLTGSLLVWLIERGHPTSRLTSYSEAIWWAIVTVTTVGYGDIVPQTGAGRVVAALLMVTGIGTIGMLASMVSSALIGRKDEAVGVAAGDLTGRLERLAALHRDGSLSDEEFRRAKEAELAGGPIPPPSPSASSPSSGR